MTFTKARLQKLNALYTHAKDRPKLPEALAELSHRHNIIKIIHDQNTETKLYKHYKTQPIQDLNGTWPIPDPLYDALDNCVNIKRVIHCNPINLPLRSKMYISHGPKDACFGGIPYTNTTWPDTSLALPEYKPDKLKQALEQAIYSAHTHRHTSPSSHILLLPIGNTAHTSPETSTLHTSKNSPQFHSTLSKTPLP
jgi:hypothetical protein